MAFIIGIVATASAGGRYFWVKHQERLFSEYLASPIPLSEQTRVKIAGGTPLSGVAQQLASLGVIDSASRFSLALIKLDLERSVRAGYYQFNPGLSYQQAIDKLISGEVHMEKFRLIEGTTFANVLENLSLAPGVEKTFQGQSLDEIWHQVAPESQYPPEGMLFPDTYLYEEGTADVEVLRKAHKQLENVLAENWPNRSENLPLDTPYEALILASIIEKESGIVAERKLISSVFVNRLRKKMRLQSDPTVIYGLGDLFNGNLTRANLREQSTHNTYTNAGLPPTPIGMVSIPSLQAALNPVESEYYYFVADGSGGHVFSKTLREHNNAVNRYQRNRNK